MGSPRGQWPQASFCPSLSLELSVPPGGQEQGHLHPRGHTDTGGHLHSNCQPKQRNRALTLLHPSLILKPRGNTHNTNLKLTRTGREAGWPAPQQSCSPARPLPRVPSPGCGTRLALTFPGWSANHLHPFHPASYPLQSPRAAFLPPDAQPWLRGSGCVFYIKSSQAHSEDPAPGERRTWGDVCPGLHRLPGRACVCKQSQNSLRFTDKLT